MKYIYKINEWVKINENQSFDEYCKERLPFLIDDGFSIKYGYDSLELKKSNKTQFEWDDISSDFIPFIELISEKYKIFSGSFVIYSNNSNKEYNVEDIEDIEEELQDIKINIIYLFFKNPEDNELFKTGLIEVLTSLGYEDIDDDCDKIFYYNPKLYDVKNNTIIYNYIDNFGYDSNDFGITSNRVEFPRY